MSYQRWNLLITYGLDVDVMYFVKYAQFFGHSAFPNSRRPKKAHFDWLYKTMG